MATTKRPRADSKLDNLPAAQFRALRDGLLNRTMTYGEALAWLRTECGIKTQNSTLSVFYKRHCQPVADERQKLLAAEAEKLPAKANTEAALARALNRMAAAIEKNTAALEALANRVKLDPT